MSKISTTEAGVIQARTLSEEFKFSHNAPYPKSMHSVEAFEKAGTRKYGPAETGKDPAVWVGIYVKDEPAPVAA